MAKRKSDVLLLHLLLPNGAPKQVQFNLQGTMHQGTVVGNKDLKRNKDGFQNPFNPIYPRLKGK